MPESNGARHPSAAPRSGVVQPETESARGLTYSSQMLARSLLRLSTTASRDVLPPMPMPTSTYHCAIASVGGETCQTGG